MNCKYILQISRWKLKRKLKGLGMNELECLINYKEEEDLNKLDNILDVKREMIKR